MEFDHKLVESTEDGDLVLALNADSWLKENNRHKEQPEAQTLQTNSKQQQKRDNQWDSFQ